MSRKARWKLRNCQYISLDEPSWKRRRSASRRLRRLGYVPISETEIEHVDDDQICVLNGRLDHIDRPYPRPFRYGYPDDAPPVDPNQEPPS